MTISAHPPPLPDPGQATVEGLAGSWRTVSVEPTGVAGGLQRVSKIPSSSRPPVARQIEVMLERDIWVRPGKDDVS